MRKRVKWSILLFLTAATLSLILFGCSQEPFNSNAEKKKAEERPTSKDGLQNAETILESLKSASPEEVIQAFFWGHSNHSNEVVNATLYHKYEKINSDYPEIKQWEVLQITKLLNPPEWLRDSEKKFNQIAYFKVKHRLTLNSGYDSSNTQLTEIAERGEIEWYFVLAKERESRWFIVSYGN